MSTHLLSQIENPPVSNAALPIKEKKKPLHFCMSHLERTGLFEANAVALTVGWLLKANVLTVFSVF